MLTGKKTNSINFLNKVTKYGQNSFITANNHVLYEITVIDINEDEYLVKTKIGFYPERKFIKKYKFNNKFYDYFNIFFNDT